MNKYIILALVAVFLGACGGTKSKVKKGEVMQTIDQEMVTGKYIEGIGICGGDMELKTQTQRRADSRDCAITKAQGELTSFINGIELEGGVRVERAVTADSVLQSKIDSAVKRAEIVKTEWTDDDGCVVTMRISKDDLQKHMGVKFK
jgi:hypothetical protein